MVAGTAPEPWRPVQLPLRLLPREAELPEAEQTSRLVGLGTPQPVAGLWKCVRVCVCMGAQLLLLPFSLRFFFFFLFSCCFLRDALSVKLTSSSAFLYVRGVVCRRVCDGMRVVVKYHKNPKLWGFLVWSVQRVHLNALLFSKETYTASIGGVARSCHQMAAYGYGETKWDTRPEDYTSGRLKRIIIQVISEVQPGMQTPVDGLRLNM